MGLTNTVDTQSVDKILEELQQNSPSRRFINVDGVANSAMGTPEPSLPVTESKPTTVGGRTDVRSDAKTE